MRSVVRSAAQKTLGIDAANAMTIDLSNYRRVRLSVSPWPACVVAAHEPGQKLAGEVSRPARLRVQPEVVA
jgi:hypothetical protein